MSEERTPDAIWHFRNASENGKKTLKIELFGAAKWKHNWNPSTRNMYPRPPSILSAREEYWEKYYRLRVGGRWYRNSKSKFHFFTMGEAVEVAEKLITNGEGYTNENNTTEKATSI